MAAVEQEPLTHDSLLKLFEERGALLEGHFQLSSGLHSPRYLQCARVLMDPALGGVLVAHEVARGLSCDGLFTERQDGKMALRRGFALEPGDEVVVVEDVITTGGSTREVMSVVESSGARVLAVGSLVDRSGGKAELGVAYRSLLELEVPSYAAAACPLCAAGGTPVKPGSRPGR